MKEIYIDRDKKRDIISVVEGDRLVSLDLNIHKPRVEVGDIYRARVNKVLDGMNSGFVSLGLGKNAYINRRDLIEDRKGLLSSFFKEGDSVLVQVRKEAIGDKGPRVSEKIELRGKYLILTPYINKVSISKKIRSKKEISRLKTLGENIMVKGFGMIIRTEAEGLGEEIKKEYQALIGDFEKIHKQRDFLPSPKLIYKASGSVESYIKNEASKDIKRIIINDKEFYKELESQNIQSLLGTSLVLDESFKSSYHPLINSQVQRALNRRLRLEDGVEIVIDELEALTAIDINTGSFTGALKEEETRYRANQIALEEIARQIRLRNLSGIIIIDIIDLGSEEKKESLIKLFEKDLEKDPLKTKVYGLSNLGLLELTRETKKPSLSSLLLEAEEKE